MSSAFERSVESADFVRSHAPSTPDIAVILGSGLGAWADGLDEVSFVNYSDIPGFPTSSVEGHAGRFAIGRRHGKTLIAMQGRVHLYEGYDPPEVAFPLRTMWQLGARNLIVTNAAGSLHDGLAPGDLMLIRDHINWTGKNPLAGENDTRFGTRFPDMTRAYDPELRERAHAVAEALGISLSEGVYVGMLGPTYETPAEIQMLHRLGGDTVGMSTVPEVIVARHLGMRVLGLSCVTNMGAGLGAGTLDHSEVQDTADRVHRTFVSLLDALVKDFPIAAEEDSS
ncbi:MAG: purine-nucleoside phosphorylase [Deltaproteobacteria bacterium]|nr:MAG: purine-nucleoside phosphorylase [Deltaproteobacteria bacterium]